MLITGTKSRLLRRGLDLLLLNKTHWFSAGVTVKVQADGELVVGMANLSPTDLRSIILASFAST